MKFYTILNSFFLLLIFSCAPYKIPLIGSQDPVEQKTLCEKDVCNARTTGDYVVFNKTPTTINKDFFKARDVAQFYIGKKLNRNSSRPDSPQSCKDQKEIDLTYIFVSKGREWDAKKGARFTGDIDATVSTNLDKLSKLNLPQNTLDSLDAKLRVFYTKKSSDTVQMVGKYYEATIEEGYYETDKIKDIFKYCLDDEGDFSIITGITFINYTVDAGSTKSIIKGLELDGTIESSYLKTILDSEISKSIFESSTFKLPATWQLISINFENKNQYN